MYINRKTGELIHEQTLKELKLWEDKDFREQYGEAMICPVDKRDCGLLCKGEHCGIHSKLIDCGITCEDKKYPCIPYIPEEYDVDNEPTFPICGTCNAQKEQTDWWLKYKCSSCRKFSPDCPYIEKKGIAPLLKDASEVTGIWDFLEGVDPVEHIRGLRE